MKLSNASVNGLFGVYDHEIELDPEGLTFIHSTNGMGKSVFLKLIKNLLKGQPAFLERIPFERMHLGFDDGTEVTVVKDGGLRVLLRRDGSEEDVGLDGVKGLLQPAYISPERLTVKTDDGRLMYAIDIYSKELEENFAHIRNESRIDVSAEVRDDGMTDGEIASELLGLTVKTAYMAEAGLGITVPEGLTMTPDDEDIGRCRGDYLALLESVRGYVDRYYGFAESVKVFQSIVNMFFVNKELRIADGRMLVTMVNGDTVPLETLSSGEKHILIIFYRILFQTQPGSLVIIDEPEISIHVSWQQKMGHTLLDLCDLRNLQMLVATHSPQIIHDMWDRANELGGERA